MENRKPSAEMEAALALSAAAEEQMDKMEEWLSMVLGHSNCYCKNCQVIARNFWKPKSGDTRLPELPERSRGEK